MDSGEDGEFGEVDPLGAYTPEVESALGEARAAIGASADLRKAAGRLLDAVNEMEQTVFKAVNSGLAKKISETASLKVDIACLTMFCLCHCWNNHK